jgi:DNA polymerase
MVKVQFDASFAEWRAAARSLLLAGIPPQEIEWMSGEEADSIFSTLPSPPARPQADDSLTVPRDFLRLAECVACFRNPSRWSLLYQVLWRLTHGERSLLQVVVDRDVHRLQRMSAAVRRDEHKMKAFVRFRRVGDSDEATARYIAWFAPSHLILQRVAPFFANRFASMSWSILTPDGSVHWNREDILFGPALDRSTAPASDELETLWRTYYASVFNPARLKLRAMRSEMPKKYWSGLPEARLIPDLVANASRRVREMGINGEQPPELLQLEDPRADAVSDA